MASVLAPTIACDDTKVAPFEPTRGSATGGVAPASPVPTPHTPSEDSGNATNAPCPEPPIPVPDVLPRPPSSPFISKPAFPDCVHPGVELDCDDGWCRIPAGCFIWGSPEWEPGRGLNGEEQGPVTLTHDFEVSQFEATVEQWEATGLEFAAWPDDFDCDEPQCPIGNVTWFDILTYANRVSAAHDPPLEPCYVFSGCQRTSDGANFYCEEFEMNAETVYECEGYRLMTRSEFQYAARAGTTTSFYSGDITVTDDLQQRSCFEEPNLEPIAWYANNSGRKTHPVGQKLPNAWGLYDTLGNASEWLHERHTGRSPSYPAQDPFGELGTYVDSRTTVGGSVIGYPSLLRVAKGLEGRPYFASTAYGFRLARTLGKGTVPTLADVSSPPGTASSDAAP